MYKDTLRTEKQLFVIKQGRLRTIAEKIFGNYKQKYVENRKLTKRKIGSREEDEVSGFFVL